MTRRLLIIAAIAAALALAGCASGSSSAARVTGHLEIGSAGCLLSSGEQVTISSPAGQVIATAALGSVMRGTGGSGGIPTYRLTVTLPPEPRYGVKVTSSGAAPYWLTRAQLAHGARIVCSAGP